MKSLEKESVVAVESYAYTTDEPAAPTAAPMTADVELDPVLAAAKRMLAALKGKGPLIEPVTVRLRPDGKYEVVEGHDIVAAAKLAGWTKFPIRLIETH